MSSNRINKFRYYCKQSKVNYDKTDLKIFSLLRRQSTENIIQTGEELEEQKIINFGPTFHKTENSNLELFKGTIERRLWGSSVILKDKEKSNNFLGNKIFQDVWISFDQDFHYTILAERTGRKDNRYQKYLLNAKKTGVKISSDVRKNNSISYICSMMERLSLMTKDEQLIFADIWIEYNNNSDELPVEREAIPYKDIKKMINNFGNLMTGCNNNNNKTIKFNNGKKQYIEKKYFYIINDYRFKFLMLNKELFRISFMFKLETLLGLTYGNIVKLYNDYVNEPWKLCYEQFLNYYIYGYKFLFDKSNKKFYTSKGMNTNNKYLFQPLEELDSKSIYNLDKIRDKNIPKNMILALRIYWWLKEQVKEEKHDFVYMNTLLKKYMVINKSGDQFKKIVRDLDKKIMEVLPFNIDLLSGIKFLKDNKIIYVDVPTIDSSPSLKGKSKNELIYTKGKVYLKYKWWIQSIFIKCIDKLLMNYISFPYFTKHLPIVRNHEQHPYQFKDSLVSLNSEQEKNLEQMKKLPICCLNGPGGVGKTELIKYIIYHYNPKEVLLVTCFNSILAKLKQNVFYRSYTPNKLIFEHIKYHDRNIFKDYSNNNNNNNIEIKKEEQVENKKDLLYIDNMFDIMNDSQCIFHNIKILIIDELSTLYTELGAKLLSGLLACGKLQKLLCCGDKNQLRSPISGDIPKIFEFALSPHYFLNLTENFRVNNGSKLLIENQEHILKGEYKKVKFDGDVCQFISTDIDKGTPQKKVGIYKYLRMNIDNLKKVIYNLIKKNNFKYDELVTITYTNNMRKILNMIVNQFYFYKKFGYKKFTLEQLIGKKYKIFVVGQNILSRTNLPSYKLKNNVILKIIQIYDIFNSRDQYDIKTDIKNTDHKKTRGWDRYLSLAPISNLNDTFEIPLNYETTGALDHATVLTNHAFQGQEAPNIIYVLDRIINRNHVYTAWSRAKKKIITVGKKSDFNSSIKKNRSVRASLLGIELRKLITKYNEDIIPKLIDKETNNNNIINNNIINNNIINNKRKRKETDVIKKSNKKMKLYNYSFNDPEHFKYNFMLTKDNEIKYIKQMIGLGIVGYKNFYNGKIFDKEVDTIIEKLKKHPNQYKIGYIISGGCRGVDTLTEEYAKKNNINLKVIPPLEEERLNKYQNRNEKIVNKSDFLIAFISKEHSKGIEMTINIAKKKNIKVYEKYV